MSRLPPKLPYFVPHDRYSLEQWTQLEELTGKRYEYHDGTLLSVEAMNQWGGEAGAPLVNSGSHEHARLGGNVVREAGAAVIAEEGKRPQLKRCDSLSSDLRIAVEGGTRYLHADAVIVCGSARYDERNPTAVVNPVVVFGVLSPSSEGYDRGLKFEFYGALASLRECVIVEQERRRVEVRAREDEGSSWRYTTYTNIEESVALPSLGLSLPMAGVYRNWEGLRQGTAGCWKQSDSR